MIIKMNLYVYIINVIVCICMIIFCGVKVLLDPRPETTSIYLPIMSGIIGYFTPSPSLTKKERPAYIEQFAGGLGRSPLPTSLYDGGSGQSAINIQSPPLSPTLNIRVPND
jgi:hypothetical protein